MLMLHQHITRALLTLFLGTLFLSSIVSYFTIKTDNIETYQRQLIAYIKIIKHQLPSTPDTLESFATLIKEDSGIRFTLINEEGVVLVDSDKDSETMDNHAHREEIVKAQKIEFAHAIRFSDSIKSNFLYVAHRFEYNNQILFLRLAMNIGSIMHNFYELWVKIALIFTLSLLLGLYGAYHLSKKIRHEIDKIIANLQQIADKDYKITLSSHFCLEFLEISNYLKKLATKLEKRARQKRKYTAKIKLISQQRSDVISAISHEFKNSIASIMGYAQTLLDDPNASVQIKERFLGKIVQNGQKISTMIDRLALTTKFENGDFTTQSSSFDIVKITHDIAQSFREKNPTRTIECHLPPHYLINADRTMMELVITNLIDNALKYSDDTITICLEENALHVKDSGVGIKEDEIDKVTKKFYRSNSHSWDNSMGLGLALVNYILKLHNTSLEIQSTLGVGSDFSFKLPSNHSVL
ncbi:sensor histidine kinase [Sulfurospirillum deleyianum]|uniref:histidine kinase n=1 Tax=Sulfurospirillum deleyianum (strain ATCC 51133 / DSM 6946 / 5175) TaxID=525898 RepID=D1B469_SULD5|nr:HAMP domain-containing sensor histidine kinase [Sulfurospirillum deleyianum]ACZ12889.1 ATP-binding region ATPase domain protein [Sulfurospirillum deleyianum DSM 6946]